MTQHMHVYASIAAFWFDFTNTCMFVSNVHMCCVWNNPNTGIKQFNIESVFYDYHD